MEEAAPAVPSVSWSEVVARLDRDIADGEARAGERLDDWVRAEAVAGQWKSRARLSGRYDDYAKAEFWIASAFGHAPEGSGPWLARARLHFTLHRLHRVLPDLERAEQRLLPDDHDRAAFALLRADLAFQQGRYEEARVGIDASLALHRDPAAVFSRAQLLQHTGDPDGALRLFDEAEGMYLTPPPETRAWLDLQRGLLELDRGRLDAAAAHYVAAERDLSGWWLIEEHQAEVLARSGSTDAALRAYEILIDRTGNPEFMDAAASILDARGDAAGAALQVTRARAAYDAQLERYPEAAAGHALRHFLEFGTDPAFTLDLAERNAALRPNGEALTLLAKAQLAAGRPGPALETIERVLATAWRSAESDEVAAEIRAARALTAPE